MTISSVRRVAPAFLLAGAACTASVRGEDASSAIDAYMTRAAEYGQFNGAILVAAGGRIVYERAFGLASMELGAPNDTATRFEIASMTKPMTAIAIMQLVQEGRVRLDGTVLEYLPWYPSESGRRITVEQLLNHTSGIPGDIAFDNPGPGSEIVAAINADLVTEETRAWRYAGSGPRTYQSTNVAAASAMTTGTNTAEIRSARR